MLADLKSAVLALKLQVGRDRAHPTDQHSRQHADYNHVTQRQASILHVLICTSELGQRVHLLVTGEVPELIIGRRGFHWVANDFLRAVGSNENGECKEVNRPTFISAFCVNASFVSLNRFRRCTHLESWLRRNNTSYSCTTHFKSAAQVTAKQGGVSPRGSFFFFLFSDCLGHKKQTNKQEKQTNKKQTKHR